MCHSKVDAHRGVFGNTGEAGESSIRMFVAMGINTSPSLTSKNARLLTICSLSSVMTMNRI